MRAYRTTFNKALSVNYWGKKDDPRITFRGVHEAYYPLVKNIKEEAKRLKIQYFWHFYEPFIEITWISTEAQSKKLLAHIKKACKKNKINDLVFEKGQPPKGFGVDWFGASEKENEFGGKMHSLCSDMTDLLWEYKDVIEAGRGVNEQLSRTIHRLTNPNGLNYNEEMKICFARGLLCFLLKHFPKHAVWLYINVFRQRLPK